MTNKIWKFGCEPKPFETRRASINAWVNLIDERLDELVDSLAFHDSIRAGRDLTWFIRDTYKFNTVLRERLSKEIK